MNINIDISSILNVVSFLVPVMIVVLLGVILRSNYEQRIVQQLLIINTQTNSFMQSTTGWSVKTEIELRLTAGQIKYAMSRGWIADHGQQYLIWI